MSFVLDESPVEWTSFLSRQLSEGRPCDLWFQLVGWGLHNGYDGPHLVIFATLVVSKGPATSRDARWGRFLCRTWTAGQSNGFVPHFGTVSIIAIRGLQASSAYSFPVTNSSGSGKE